MNVRVECAVCGHIQVVASGMNAEIMGAERVKAVAERAGWAVELERYNPGGLPDNEAMRVSRALCPDHAGEASP